MLNVYKVSGLPKIGSVEGSKYQYWNGGTLDATNTRAFNWLLSDVNYKLTEIAIGSGDIAEHYNTIDLDIICLEALEKHKDNAELYPIDFLGAVIAQMVDDGCFLNDSTDENVRSENLDNLINLFGSKLTDSLNGNFSNNFLEWWNLDIIPNNYNGMTSAQIDRYKQWFEDNNEKVGADGGASLNSELPKRSDYTSMSDWLIDCGPCFAYMFIEDADAKKYNKTIRYKRLKEYDYNFKNITNNVGGMFTEEQILIFFKTGIMRKTGQTIEASLQDLYDNGGKIGSWTAVVTAILAIVSVLISLYYLIKDVYQLSYDYAADAEEYIPNEDDLSTMFDSTNNTASLSGGWIAAVVALGIGALYKFSKKNNNKTIE